MGLMAFPFCLAILAASISYAGGVGPTTTPIVLPADETITGTVTDEGGQALPGVSIVVKGTTRGTTTDAQGNYRIGVPGKTAILIFSFVGYISQEEPVGNRSSLNIALKVGDKTLSEIVVVGYGTQSRRNVTGAIAKVDLKQLENLPNTNIAQSLRGRVAGVQFVDNGRPGQGGSVLVRGQRSISAANDPLIVVDGIFFNGSLADINPNDIESMEVLKDASAGAIYGSRAANGVVLITSRKGTSEKPTIRVNAYYGVSDWSHKMKLLSPERYIQKTLDFRRQTGQAADPAQIGLYLQNTEAENYKNGRTIDPWDEISQQGSVQSYDLSLSGRSGKTGYYVSGSLTNEKGIVYNDNSKRISLRSNIDNQITPWLKMGITSQFTNRDLSGLEGSVYNAYWITPYGKMYYDDARTDPVVYPQDETLALNPMFNALLNKNEEIKQNLFANFYAIVDVPFVKGLTYRVNYSPNYRWEHTYTASPIYKRNGLNNTGAATKYNRQDFDWVLENIATYSKQLSEKHEFDVTVLYGRNHRGYEATYANGANFFTDVLNWNSLKLAQIQTDSSRKETQEGISSMLRLNYRFMNRYLFTVTARRDGTSVFGANDKFATFPSAALAWVTSDEPFMRKFSFINLLKVRLSYGSVGNQAINPYQSLSKASTAQYVFGDGGTTSTAVYTSSISNPNLHWETTTSKNIAIDFDLFRGRVGGTIEYYDLDTKDLLLNRALPITTGFSNILTNVGATNNKGFEFSLNTVNLRRGPFEWSSNLVFSTNRNRITHLYRSDSNNDGVEDDDVSNRWFIGKPVSVAYDYTVDGVYQEGDALPAGYKPGFLRLKDLNGDGLITATADRSVIGQLQPKYRWGFTNTVRYGNLSFTVFLNAMQGWIQAFNLLEPQFGTGQGNFPERSVNLLDAGWWTAENKSTTRPSLAYTNPYAHGFYTSRDFLRIQDVSLAYELPKAMVSRLHIGSARLYVSGKNLYTFTNYPGFDPESGYNTQGSLFPMARSITGGFNLSF